MENFSEFMKGYNEENQPFDINALLRERQKSKELQKSISKPKGDIDMKNVTYRPREKRYIGRKQIFNKTITVYAKSQRECAAKLNQKIKEEREALKSQFVVLTHMTVLQYWDKWYAENKRPFISDGTRKEFELIKKKMQPIWNCRLTELTKENILLFLEGVKENRTKEKLIVQFRSMLDFAVKERKIKYNPFDTIIVRSKRRPPRPPFNYEEQKTILEHLKGKEFEPIILVYLTTGLRKNEMPFKDIEAHIDKNNILHVQNLKARNREVRYKNIKISDALRELIFANLETFHNNSMKSIYSKFKSFLKSLNIQGSIVTCRHTFATNCFYLEKPELVIAKEMGHSTSQITKDNYINIEYDLSKEKILKLYNNLYNLI